MVETVGKDWFEITIRGRMISLSVSQSSLTCMTSLLVRGKKKCP